MKKILDDYRDLYVLTDDLRVMNIGDGPGRTVNKLLVPFLGRGYLRVRLSRNQKVKNFSLHRIIAEEKIPNPDNKPVVNHINGIKTDNRIENLEWCTPKENTQHALKHGLLRGYHKEMLDTNTGIFYRTLREACFHRCIKPMYLANLIYKKRNNTGLVFI